MSAIPGRESFRSEIGFIHLLERDEVPILEIDTDTVMKGDLAALVLVALGFALVLGDVAIGDFVLGEVDDGAGGVPPVFELREGGSYPDKNGNGGELHCCVQKAVPQCGKRAICVVGGVERRRGKEVRNIFARRLMRTQKIRSSFTES